MKPSKITLYFILLCLLSSGFLGQSCQSLQKERNLSCQEPLEPANFVLIHSLTDTLSNAELSNPVMGVDSVYVAFYDDPGAEPESGIMEVTQGIQCFHLQVTAKSPPCLAELDSVRIKYRLNNETQITNTATTQPFINGADLLGGPSSLLWESTSALQPNGNIISSILIDVNPQPGQSSLEISGGLAVVVITIDPPASMDIDLYSASFKLYGSDQWVSISLQGPIAKAFE